MSWLPLYIQYMACPCQPFAVNSFSGSFDYCHLTCIPMAVKGCLLTIYGRILFTVQIPTVLPLKFNPDPVQFHWSSASTSVSFDFEVDGNENGEFLTRLAPPTDTFSYTAFLYKHVLLYCILILIHGPVRYLLGWRFSFASSGSRNQSVSLQ